VKRGSRRVALALSVLALAALPFGQWAATAHTQTYKTNLSIHFDKHADSIWGHVGSSSFCQEDRTVEVFKDGISIGTTLSEHAGMWSVDSQGSGDYYATVAESHTVGYDHDHTCLADTSSTTTVN
jgi:hypothetical protein